MTGPSDRWYEPPEPVICCSLAEDEDDHDVQACLADQAEEAAERRAEARMWRDEMDRFDREGWPT